MREASSCITRRDFFSPQSEQHTHTHAYIRSMKESTEKQYIYFFQQPEIFQTPPAAAQPVVLCKRRNKKIFLLHCAPSSTRALHSPSAQLGSFAFQQQQFPFFSCPCNSVFVRKHLGCPLRDQQAAATWQMCPIRPGANLICRSARLHRGEAQSPVPQSAARRHC